jgi:hypothetical protein
VLLDLYVTSQTPDENGSGAPDARADRIRGKLGPIPPAVDRVAVAGAGRTGRGVAGPTGSPSAAARTGRRWRIGPSAAGTHW